MVIIIISYYYYFRGIERGGLWNEQVLIDIYESVQRCGVYNREVVCLSHELS